MRNLNNHDQLRDYIRKILYHDQWMFANIEIFTHEVLQKRNDEVEPLMVKLMADLQLPMCQKYQSLFVDYDRSLDNETLVEVTLRKLLKAAYKWQTRTVNNIELLEEFIKDSRRDSFDTLPELGIRSSPFTDFLLYKILVLGMATPMRVYQQLKNVENNGLHRCLGYLYDHPEKDTQILFLKQNGVEFLDEYLNSEQESAAYIKEIDGRSLFDKEQWEGAIKNFLDAANLSDNRKSKCYAFICICYTLLKKSIISEEYLYKSTEFFNSEDGECARLYAVAMAGHGELEMAKQIFTKSLNGSPFDEDDYESFLQIPAVMEIVNQLLEDKTPTLTFLPK